MLINDVGPMRFCSSGRLNYQRLVRCWSNALSPTSPAYASVMSTIRFQLSIALGQRWSDTLRVLVIIDSLEKLAFPYFVILLITVFSSSLSRMIFLKLSNSLKITNYMLKIIHVKQNHRVFIKKN